MLFDPVIRGVYVKALAACDSRKGSYVKMGGSKCDLRMVDEIYNKYELGIYSRMVEFYILSRAEY